MKATILLIEDNETNRYLTTFLLTQRGYRVVAAASAHDGLELAVTCAPALILLDIQLPDMDGYSVARQLKQRPEFESIPIIAVTSYAMANDKRAALAAGCDGFIEKPIDPTTFVDTVEKHLLSGSDE